MDEPTTSVLRQHAFAAITQAAWADDTRRRWLGEQLAVRGYQSRTDDEIIDMCYEAGVPVERVPEIAALDATRFPDFVSTYLCPSCLDNLAVRIGDTNRFERCPTCNPVPQEYNPDE